MSGEKGDLAAILARKESVCRAARRLRRGGEPESKLVLADGLLPPDEDFLRDFTRFAPERETRGFDRKRRLERRHARIRGGTPRQKRLRQERPTDASGDESQSPGAAVDFPMVGIDDVRGRRLAVARVHDDLPVSTQVVGRKRGKGGQGVRLRHHDRNGGAPENPFARLDGGLRREDERRVHAGFLEEPLRFRTGDVFDLQPYARKALRELLQDLDHDGGFEHRIDSEVERGLRRVGKRRRARLEPLRLGEEAKRRRKKLSSPHRKFRPGGAVKEGVAEVGLQTRHVHGEHRLRTVEPSRRGGKGTRFRHRCERADFVDFDAHAVPPTISFLMESILKDRKLDGKILASSTILFLYVLRINEKSLSEDLCRHDAEASRFRFLPLHFP